MHPQGSAPQTAAPSGPPVYPSLDLPDRVFDFCRSPQNFLLETARSGPIVLYRLNSEIFAVTGDPDILHRILNTPGEDFHRGDFAELLEVVSGKNILTAFGPEWSALRTLFAPLFTPRRIDAMWSSVQDVIARHMDRWAVCAGAGEPFSLHQATKRLAFDLVARTFVGIEGSQADDTFEAIDRVNRKDSVRLYILAKRAAAMHGAYRTSAANSEMDRVSYAVADTRLNSLSTTDDMIGAIMARPFFEEMSYERRREFLREFVASVLVAGYATTADTMFWAIYLLAQHHDWQDRLSTEIPNQPSPPLRAVINETLRLYPAAWYIGRVALRDVEIGGVRIAAGTRIACTPYVLHRMAANWPEPDAFRPERFLPGVPIAPRSFIPFGSGMHSCLGRGLALLELNGLLPTALRRFRFDLMAPVQSELAATFTLQPRDEVFVRIAPR
jgi:cytochrome P450